MTLLHHEISGPAGAPVLLLAGSLGATLKMWDAQLALADRLRLVRFDHRGHGGSPVPPPPYELADLGGDVLELMDALGLERVSFAGVSMGGTIGMWLAVNAPDRVDRLVLICTSAHMPPPELWQERAAAVMEAGSPEVIADGVVERWLTPAFAAEHPEVRAELRAMLASTDAVAYAACCRALERVDLRPDLPRIAAPTLVISGSDDPSTPLEHQEVIAAGVPGARHEVIAPAAHLAAVERPEAVNALIAEHLGGATPPRAP